MIGNRIKEARKNKKISQRKLADMLGISASSVSLYELNRIEPSDLIKESIIKNLEISLDYLTGKVDYEENEVIKSPKNSSNKKNKMNDSFMDKLVQTNISADQNKTKERIKNIWETTSKEDRKELIKDTGKAMYNNIGMIIKKGRITAKMTILLSRYLNANPFYLIGKTDERGNFNEDLLKEFLIKFGYKKLWNEYAKVLKINKTDNDKNNQIEINEPNEPIEPIEPIESIETPIETFKMSDEEKEAYIRKTLKELGVYDKKHENFETPINTISVDEPADISPETLDYINTLSEDSIISLLRATLIRANAPNANIKHKQLANQIIYKMLSY